jgi:hypothetical protein
MQPYFIPYAGYFRLFALTDLFVVYDCVQFPRRRWLHRNRLQNINKETRWLTLPILKTDRDTTRIVDLQFQKDAQKIFNNECKKFPSFELLKIKQTTLYNSISALDRRPIDYIIDSLTAINEIMGIDCPIIRSSTLNIDANIKGKDRIIAIAKQLGAKSYINSPGGRDLYRHKDFSHEGIKLEFLSTYAGSYSSMVDRLSNENLSELKSEFNSNLS